MSRTISAYAAVARASSATWLGLGQTLFRLAWWLEMAQSFHERFHGLLETWPENALDCMLLVLMQLRPNEWSPTRAVLNARLCAGMEAR